MSVTGISSGALRTEGDLSPALYDALAVVQRAAMPDFPLSTCMNYGWAAADDPKRPAPELEASGERHCLQMYDVVVRASRAGAFGEKEQVPPPLDPRAAVEPRDGTRPRLVRGCVPAQASYLPKSPHISPQAAVGSDERGLLSGLDVVEVGCGRGGGAAFLFSRHAPSSLTGVDAAPQQIEQARRRFGAQGEALQFRVGAADSLPVEDDSADLLLSVESMHTYTDKAAFLREARRVLRPGGALARRPRVRSSWAAPAILAAILGCRHARLCGPRPPSTHADGAARVALCVGGLRQAAPRHDQRRRVARARVQPVLVAGCGGDPRVDAFGARSRLCALHGRIRWSAGRVDSRGVLLRTGAV